LLQAITNNKYFYCKQNAYTHKAQNYANIDVMNVILNI